MRGASKDKSKTENDKLIDRRAPPLIINIINILHWCLKQATRRWWHQTYVTEQVFQVVVGGALALVLRELLHVAVEAEVQPGQLLLHLSHVLQLLEGAHFS